MDEVLALGSGEFNMNDVIDVNQDSNSSSLDLGATTSLTMCSRVASDRSMFSWRSRPASSLARLSSDFIPTKDGRFLGRFIPIWFLQSSKLVINSERPQTRQSPPY